MKKLFLAVGVFIFLITNLSLRVSLETVKLQDTITIVVPIPIRLTEEQLLANQLDFTVKQFNDVVEHIKFYEGFSSIPYTGVAKDYLIGYGHLIRTGETFENVSLGEGEILLEKDFCDAIKYTYLYTGLSGIKLLAVSALVYNVGIGYFYNSGLYAKIRTAKQSEITEEWLKYAYYKKYEGKAYTYTWSKSLQLRRNWEILYYLSHDKS